MCGISSRYATAIHGACVSLDGAGILLCGDSGAGKTTLSYACARAGWTFVSDDGSYLVHDRDDRVVAGNCNQVRFRPTAETLFPELHGRQVMERAGVGKPSVEVDTGEISRLTTASTASIKHIVFLKRDVEAQELAVFPTAVARLFMMQPVYCMPYAGLSRAEAIDHLLHLGAWELRYNDLGWAVDRLECLAREGF
jgi:predicted ATPase